MTDVVKETGDVAGVATAGPEKTPAPGLGVSETPGLDVQTTAGADTAAKIEADAGGVISTLARLSGNTILTLDALSRVFGVCPKTIRRSIQRGEIPPSIALPGRAKASWTVGVILSHIQGRLERAAAERERMARKIEALKP